jgi:hypothetical protein
MNEIRESVATYGIEAGAPYDPDASRGYEDLLSILRKFRPSKESTATRTSPVVNSLNHVWVITVAGSPLIDINRVHRNLYFDITSSDPVEDYLQFESGEEAGRDAQASISKMPEEVVLFCEQEGILQYVLDAIRIIKQSFKLVENVELDVEEDPETAEKWILIAITVHGGVEEILEQYDCYTESWVSSAPWPECHKIRLSFDIV